MKTPDEIKKGLTDPVPVHYHVGDFEPRLTPLAMCDLEAVHADAFALIEQLEDDKDELLEKVEQLEEDIKNIREGNPVGAVALVGRELLARLQAQIPRWISVEEKLPEVSAESNGYQITDVVLATTAGYICFGYFEIFKYNGTWEFVCVDTDCDFDRSVTITHWMPLPEPPQEE